MPAVRIRDAVLVGKYIARDRQVAAIVAACQTELRGGIGRSAAAHHQGADGVPLKKARKLSRGGAWSGFAREEVPGAGKAGAKSVQQRRREDMRFLKTRDLFPQRVHISAVVVGAGRRKVGAVIDGVDRVERVFREKI